MSAERGGVNEERPIAAEGERRVEEAGLVPEEGPGEERRWRDPDTGEALPGALALARVERQEERGLEEAGWEREEVEGETYWRNPISGHLYPRGPAHDLMSGRGADA